MPVKQITVSKQHGFEGTQADFHRTLIEVKDARFPSFTDEELTYTRDEADPYCAAVRQKLGLADLPRPFILRSLVGIRKNSVRI
jgi:hypothetical protein